MGIKKRRTRWISILLSLMMVFAFMPFLGIQEAHAIPIEDTITILDKADSVYAALTGDQVALTDIRVR